MLGGLRGERIEQQIGDVIGQRPPDEKLHREIIDPLGILALVGLFGPDPALRENVAHRAGKGLEPLAGIGGREVRDVIEEQVTVVEARRACR